MKELRTLKSVKLIRLVLVAPTDLNVAFYDVVNWYFLFHCILANHSANFSLLEFHEKQIAKIWREARNFVTELFDVNASKEFHLFSCLVSIEDRV